MTMLAIIGNIATLFSNLEWQMSNVLAKLIDTSDNSIAGSFLADDLTLSKTTQLIQKLTLPFCACRFAIPPHKEVSPSL